MVQIDQENMLLFWYYTWERQNVYHNRFVLNKKEPWTKDKILREYKFTNVYRELDRTTIWYHDRIGGHYYKTGKTKNYPDGFTSKDVVFATFIHRLFNKIETMEHIYDFIRIKTFNLSKITSVLKKLRQQDFKIFTSAHLTTGVRFGGYDDKLDNILYLINLIHLDIDNVYTSIKSATSMEDLYNKVRMVNGFGPFLGYQFALDIVNTGICRFSLDDFSVAGPGCKRGIKHVFPNVGEDISFLDAMKFMRKKQHYYFEKFGYDFKFVDELGGREKGIHLGNIENQFCEFSKYFKAFHGYGRPRNKFVPTDLNKDQLSLFGQNDN